MTTWKTADSAPRKRTLLVANNETGNMALATFDRLSKTETVWGWIWAEEHKESGRKLFLLMWEPTHWAEPPDKPAKPKCPPGKCKLAN